MTDQDLRPAPEVGHIPWAFSLREAASLPLTGEQHPLRRESARWLNWANAITLVLVLAIFGGWVWWSQRQPEPTAHVRPVKIVRYTDLGVPPAIARPSAPQVNVAEEVARIAAPPPAIAVPEPVADERATTRTIATQAEMVEALEPITLDDLSGGDAFGDSLVIDIDIDTSPSPDDFVAVEEEPVRLRIDAPVYPELARNAEIEGTVLVRVLVGKDGKVRDVIFMTGPEALRAAAIDCAQTAVFRPALMDHKPVEVWVAMPITFKLN